MAFYTQPYQNTFMNEAFSKLFSKGKVAQNVSKIEVKRSAHKIQHPEADSYKPRYL